MRLNYLIQVDVDCPRDESDSVERKVAAAAARLLLDLAKYRPRIGANTYGRLGEKIALTLALDEKSRFTAC
jgi:hypothetical protein